MLKTHDSAPRAGREGGIEMLNCEGRGPGKSCRPSRSAEVKPSSNRSHNLYYRYVALWPVPVVVPVGCMYPGPGAFKLSTGTAVCV